MERITVELKSVSRFETRPSAERRTLPTRRPERSEKPRETTPQDRVSVARDDRREVTVGNGLLEGLSANFGSADSLERQAANDRPRPVETGTLDYYEERAQDYERRHPGEEAPDYYREFGDKYARRFEELKDELSPAGDRWVDETRENLQESLEDLRREDPEAFARLEEDPDALREFAFESHSQAYLEAGLADLPAEDLLAIATTPDLKDTLNPDGLEEFAETVVPVLAENPELLLEVPAELLQQLPGAVLEGLADLGGEVAERLGNLFDWLPDINIPNPLDWL